MALTTALRIGGKARPAANGSTFERVAAETGGTAGIAEFTELRWITIETAPHYPF